MKGQKLDVVRGSGNVFRDLGHSNADVAQFKAILATEIINRLGSRVEVKVKIRRAALIEDRVPI